MIFFIAYPLCQPCIVWVNQIGEGGARIKKSRERRVNKRGTHTNLRYGNIIGWTAPKKTNLNLNCQG